MARYGVWAAVIGHIIRRDRRFQASVITGAIGAYALGSVTKNNQARPLRRATAWYNVQGQVHDMEVLHRGRRALKPGIRLDPEMVRSNSGYVRPEMTTNPDRYS